MRKQFPKILSLLIILYLSPIYCQVGGLYTYDFLNLTQSARSTALAGFTISIADDDIAQGYSNPALLNEEMNHKLSINHNFHLTDISHGFIAYGLNLDSQNIFLMLGVNYIDYGSFDRADIFGNRNGTFKGSEAAITLGASRKLDERLRIGLNLKYAHSNFDTYNSSGLGLDLGLHYYNPEKQSNWALVFKNFGGQLSAYDIEKESFPIDIQLGYAKRLAHLPLKIMITAHHLQKWNLRTEAVGANDPIFIGQPVTKTSSFSKGVDNLFRHLAFGGEFLIGKNEVLRIRLGYNHLRNKELSVAGFRSLSGFSFGVGFKIKKLHFDYGVGRYHLAGGVNHLSVTIDLNSIFDKV